MKFKILPVLIIFLLSGCSVLNTLFYENQIFKPKHIEGDWITYVKGKKNSDQEIAENTWEIKSIDEFGYHIQIKSPMPNGYYFKLGKIKNKLFCEYQFILYLSEDSIKLTDDRFIGKCEITDSIISFFPFNVDRVIEKENNKGNKIDFVEVGSPEERGGTDLMITEETEKLQNLVIKYYNDDEVFENEPSISFKRL